MVIGWTARYLSESVFQSPEFLSSEAVVWMVGVHIVRGAWTCDLSNNDLPWKYYLTTSSSLEIVTFFSESLGFGKAAHSTPCTQITYCYLCRPYLFSGLISKLAVFLPLLSAIAK